MKKAMQLKSSDHCCICTREWISSVKGDHERIRIISMYDKQLLKLLSMKLLEVDFSTGHLTLPGFREGSCIQANFPDYSQTLFKPIAKNHHRLKATSRNFLSALEHVPDDDFNREWLQNIPKAYNGKRDFIFPEIDRLAYPKSIVTTEFRRQRNSLENCSEKIVTIALNVHMCSFTHFDGIERIYLGKSLKTSCATVNEHFWLIASKLPDVQILGNKPLQWQKIRQSKWLIASSIKRENRAEIGIEIYNRFSNN